MSNIDQKIVSVIHARTTNNANGHPRRCYVGINCDGAIVKVHDEGFGNAPEWVKDLQAIGTYPVDVNVTPQQYRSFIRRIINA